MSNQRGNVLFLILIAVALFAALSYAVTQSTRGGGNTDSENVQLEVAELLNYATGIRTAVTRMKISGVADEDICFASPNWGHVSYGTNIGACSDPDGAVFLGDGDQYLKFPKNEWLDSAFGPSYGGYGAFAFTGIYRVVGIGTDGSNPENNELMMMLPYITEEMCDEINKQVGLPYDPVPADPEEFHIGNSGNRFAGSYDDVSGFGSIIGDDNPIFIGQDTGCAFSNNEFYFWAVLIAR